MRQPDHLPEAHNTYRLFISSTFSDFVAEREALHDKVFPYLRALCQSYGARFQAIDLRWGVSEEAGVDQRTMEICLGEIRRCQHITPRPNFLILLGDRYGWLPVPARVPSDEFERLEGGIDSAADRALLRKWFRRDDNGVPPEYRLQPRTGQYRDYEAWQPVERRLHGLLAAAATEASLPADALAKYICSATHQEIREGALGSPGDHAFCYLRNLQVPPDGAIPPGFFDLDEDGAIDPVCAARIDAVRMELESSLPHGHVRAYSPTIRGGTLDEAYLSELAGDVKADLGTIVERQLQELEAVSAVQREVAAHRSFGISHTRRFVGREQTVERILSYVDGAAPGPLVVYGHSGSGKTALVARIIQQLRAREDEAVLAYRFVGATPASTDIDSLLRSLADQITEAFGAEVDEGEAEPETLPASERFAGALKLATAERPLVVVLDAVDQLSPAGSPHSLDWLPKSLPAHARVVISALEREDTEGAALRTARIALGQESLLRVEPMTAAEGARMLDRMLRDAGRALTDEQRGDVLGKFGRCPEGRALFLKLAFEEARHWTSYGGLPTGADDVPGLADTVEGVIEDMLARLRAPEEHGAVLPERTLAYLRTARYGLTEDELLDLLSRDTDVMVDFAERSPKSPDVDRLPTAAWSRLYLDLDPYLTRRQSGDAVLIDFFHRQVGEVVERLFLSGEMRTVRHQALLDYFGSMASWADLEQRRPAHRKVNELVHHCLGAADSDALEQALTDPDFLEAKAEAGLVFELASDIARACAALPPHRPWAPKLRVLSQALQEDVYFLAQRPRLLFQCLWNHLWWYDSAMSAEYCQEPEDGWGPSGPPWQQQEPKLSSFMERWREFKESREPGFYWLRSLLPPTLSLGGAHVAALRGHTDRVWQAEFMPDGERIVTCSGFTIPGDHTVRIWDVRSGEELLRIEAAGAAVQCVAVSPDGERIASSGADPIICIWDAQSGEMIGELAGHTGHLWQLRWSPDGRYIASCSRDETARVWDVDALTERTCFSAHTQWVHSVAWSPDGELLASASKAYEEPHGVRVWRRDTGEQVAHLVLDVHHPWGWTSEVGDCVFVDDTHVAVAYGLRVGIWDLHAGVQVLSILAPGGGPAHLGISRDRRFLAAAGEFLYVWDTQNWQLVGRHAREKGSPRAYSVALSADGRYAVLTQQDQLAHVVETTALPAATPRPPGMMRVWPMDFSPDGDWLCFANVESSGPPDRAQLFDTRSERPGPQLAGKTVATKSRPCFHFTATAGHVSDGANLWRASDGHLLVPDVDAQDARAFPFTADGRLFVHRPASHTSARVLDIDTGDEVACLHAHGEYVRCCCICATGAVALTGHQDGAVRAWDVATQTQIGEPLRHEAWVEAVALSPCGTIAASAGIDGIVAFWNLRDNEPVATTPTHPRGHVVLAWAPDQQTVASGGADGRIVIWDPETGAHRASDQLLTSAIGGLAFSPDGAWLAAASNASGGSLSAWAVPSLEQRFELKTPVQQVIFDADGNCLLTGEYDRAAQMSRAVRRSPETGEEIAPVLSGHSLDILGNVPGLRQTLIATSSRTTGSRGTLHTISTETWKTTSTRDTEPAHRLGGTGSGDLVARDAAGHPLVIGPLGPQALCCHDTATGEVVQTLHTGIDILATSASADGSVVAAGCEDGSVHVWEIGQSSPACVLSHPESRPEAISISGGRTRVAVTCKGDGLNSGAGGTHLWTLSPRRQPTLLRGELPVHGAAAFTTDGAFCSLVRRRGDSWMLWDAEGTVRARLDFFDEGLRHHWLSPGADHLVAACRDGTVRHYELETRAQLGRWAIAEGQPGLVTGSSDGLLLAIACETGVVVLADAVTGSTVGRHDAGDDTVYRFQFIHGDRRLLIDSSNWLRVLDCATGDEAWALSKEGRVDRPRAAVAANGRYLAVWSKKSVQLYEASSMSAIADFEPTEFTALDCVAVGDMGQIAYSGTPAIGGVQLVIRAHTGERLARLYGHTGRAESLILPPDPSLLVEQTRNTIRVWNWMSGEAIRSLDGEAFTDLTQCAAGASGDLLLSGVSTSPAVSIINAENGAESVVLRNRFGRVDDFRFSPDGRLCATQHPRATCLWRVEDGALERVYEGVHDAVAVANAQGTDWWLAAKDGPVTAIRNAGSGQEVAWAPTDLRSVRHHPSGGMWAGVGRTGLVMWKLEGGTAP